MDYEETQLIGYFDIYVAGTVVNRESNKYFWT